MTERRRYRFWWLAAALVTLATTCARAEGADRAAILLPGSVNDQSWNALGYRVPQNLVSHGFTTAYAENVADEAEALRDYASRGFNPSIPLQVCAQMRT